MHDPNAHIEASARRWYGVHSPEYLSCDAQRMVDTCGAHLARLYDLSQRQAEDAARAAWADLRHPQAGGYVEVDRCTQSMVVLRDREADTTHMLTSAELLALVRERQRPAWIGIDFASHQGGTGDG